MAQLNKAEQPPALSFFHFSYCFPTDRDLQILCLHILLGSWSKILGSREGKDFLDPSLCPCHFFLSPTCQVPQRHLVGLRAGPRPFPVHPLPYLYSTGRCLLKEKGEKERMNAFVWTQEQFNKWFHKIHLLQPSTNAQRGQRTSSFYV